MVTQREGCLRALTTVSMDGPNTEQNLLLFLNAFSEYGLRINKFHFLVNNDDWEIMPGFGPSTVRRVFACMPHLEELCLDHDNMAHGFHFAQAAPWPGSWVSTFKGNTRGL